MIVMLAKYTCHDRKKNGREKMKRAGSLIGNNTAVI
jgi:hypothetical protein